MPSNTASKIEQHGTGPSGSDSPGTQETRHLGLLARIGKLPAGVGVILMGIGAVGLIVPGPIGTPFILAGGLVLAPRIFGAVDRCVQHRLPTFYWTGMEAVERFMDDFEKRYPSGKAPAQLATSGGRLRKTNSLPSTKKKDCKP